MPEHGIRSEFSQCPFQILMYDDGGLISTGTAFFYLYKDKNFLVTNWHNISGLHFLSKENLSGSNRTPVFIKAKFSQWIVNPYKPLVENKFLCLARDFPIYCQETKEPLWYEHPDLQASCDVVAIPFDRNNSLIPDFMHKPANTISNIRIPVKPGNNAFIIGYPLSMSVGFGLPIWKSGYIASEPAYDVTIQGDVSEVAGLAGGINLPAFFIDSLTINGLSGSPVFASYFGNWDVNDPYKSINPSSPEFWDSSTVALGENRMEFVGIYSARIGRKEEGASLGLCWRKEIIDYICEKAILGKHPHIKKS